MTVIPFNCLAGTAANFLPQWTRAGGSRQEHAWRRGRTAERETSPLSGEGCFCARIEMPSMGRTPVPPEATSVVSVLVKG